MFTITYFKDTLCLMFTKLPVVDNLFHLKVCETLMILFMAVGTHRTHLPQVPPQTSLWHHLRPATKQTHPVTTGKQYETTL